MTYEATSENHQQYMIVEEQLEKEPRLKKDLLRILHIWNIAGVGGLIARYMDRYYNTQSFCIMRSPHDPFNLMTNGKVYDERALKWYIRAILMSRKYDVLHLHTSDKLIPILKFLYPSKKIIIHYHGTKIRDKWDTRKKYWKWADHIIVSTPDLLEGSPKNAIYIPNVIDEDLALQYGRLNKKKGSAFHVDRFALDKANEYANNYNLNLIVHNRDRHPLSHEIFLKKLANYEYVIDVKRDFNSNKILEAMSLSGLEALACGCKVINWRGELIEGFPIHHKSENVTRMLYDLYQGCFDEL